MWGEGREEMSQGRAHRRAAWGPFLSCHRQQNGRETQGKGAGGKGPMGRLIITPAEILVGGCGFFLVP